MFKRPGVLFTRRQFIGYTERNLPRHSPVLPLIAINWPHGGFWHGHAFAPRSSEYYPCAHRLRTTGNATSVPPRCCGHTCTARAIRLFLTQPCCLVLRVHEQITQCAVARRCRPSSTPPIEPGYKMLLNDRRARRPIRIRREGSLIDKSRRCAPSDPGRTFACSALVSAAVTISSALITVARERAGGFSGIGCVGRLLLLGNIALRHRPFLQRRTPACP